MAVAKSSSLTPAPSPFFFFVALAAVLALALPATVASAGGRVIPVVAGGTIDDDAMGTRAAVKRTGDVAGLAAQPVAAPPGAAVVAPPAAITLPTDQLLGSLGLQAPVGEEAAGGTEVVKGSGTAADMDKPFEQGGV